VDALILEAIMFQVTDQRSDDASGRGEKGQGLAEYALILGLIALIAIGAVMFLGQSMNTMFSNLGTSI
jgi:Flp pilus assembly pilin Flp